MHSTPISSLGSGDISDFSSSPVELAQKARVMTLATESQNGVWAAPIYFIFWSGLFYFFSSPDSRHIREGLSGFCGASLYIDSRQAREIQGLQMEGSLGKARGASRSLQVAAGYVKKYQLISQGNDALSFLQERFRASLYFFKPQTIYHMNNWKALGFREMVTL